MFDVDFQDWLPSELRALENRRSSPNPSSFMRHLLLLIFSVASVNYPSMMYKGANRRLLLQRCSNAALGKNRSVCGSGASWRLFCGCAPPSGVEFPYQSVG